MATQSFYEDLVLDTEEAVKNLEAAIEETERRGPLNVEGAQVSNCLTQVHPQMHRNGRSRTQQT